MYYWPNYVTPGNNWRLRHLQICHEIFVLILRAYGRRDAAVEEAAAVQSDRRSSHVGHVVGGRAASAARLGRDLSLIGMGKRSCSLFLSNTLEGFWIRFLVNEATRIRVTLYPGIGPGIIGLRASTYCTDSVVIASRGILSHK